MGEQSTMTKEDLVKLIKELKVPLSESTPRDEEMEEEIRIHYWDYIWEDLMASGEKYNMKVTYQVSVISNKPRHSKLLELKRKLNSKGLHPVIQHEYFPEKRRVHSFFSIEVLENV